MKPVRRDLPLDEVEAGMVLADAVCDAKGTVLLPGGASLTDAALTGLGRRGIETLSVLVIPTLSDEQLAARQTQIAQRLDHIFRLAGDDGAVRALKHQIGLYMQECR